MCSCLPYGEHRGRWIAHCQPLGQTEECVSGQRLPWVALTVTVLQQRLWDSMPGCNTWLPPFNFLQGPGGHLSGAYHTCSGVTQIPQPDSQETDHGQKLRDPALTASGGPNSLAGR